ncbi:MULTISPECIES: acyl-CoA dehydrogenase family protein [unclassified Microbacterium]|uniref:acyl-CoA dehydrogenase family protein n=1 Tax=unclassified Microbacterium TaxID=2609290 RepID=UPI0034677969
MDDETREMLHQAVAEVFADEPSDLWGSLQSVGMDRALVPENNGGIGVDWAVACDFLQIAGSNAAAVPIAEAMIGHWLIDLAGAEETDQPTIAFPSVAAPVRLSRSGDSWRVDGTLTRVPWGGTSTHIVFVSDTPTAQLVVVDRQDSGVSVTSGLNIAGDPRDEIRLENVVPAQVVPAPFESKSLLLIAAIARSALMAGALERALSLSVEYANMRVQFGRPIGKFQAVQQNVSVLATQVAAARAATEGAGEAIDAWLAGEGEPLLRSIAALSAKIRTGEAAGAGSAIAHQVFGAIGFTEEHQLRLFTKRLWSWRDEFGNESFWADELGREILGEDLDTTLWRTVAPLDAGLSKGESK